MKQIRYQIIFLLLTIGFSLTLFNISNTYAEQPKLDPTSSLLAFNNNNDVEYHIYALNNIYFVEPCRDSNGSSSYSSGTCGQKLTATDAKSRLQEAVEKFGGFAMDMQVKYGVPWEAIFFHMYGESQMGLNGLAKDVEKCGYYNTMGYVYSSSSLYGITEEKMGDCTPHHGDNGALAAQFPSYEDMIMSYYTDYVRNGLYDKAFDYLDPKNYDLEGFLKTESDIYSAAGWDGRVPGYGAYKDVWYSIKETIYDVAKAKNWPTSKELAKQKNIPIGGEYPVKGDIKKQLNAAPHSLSACDGFDSTSGDEDSSDDESSDEDNDSSSSSKSSSNKKSSSKSSSDSDSDSDSDDDSAPSPSGTSFPIDPNTPPTTADLGGYWFFEQDWNDQGDSTVSSRSIAAQESMIDEDFAHMAYVYADNYDIDQTWPYKWTKNGGNSKRKYYWATFPDKALTTRQGDKFVAYFENRKEPVYFVTYDVWDCDHQPGKGVNYCHDAEKNPDDVVFGKYTIGYAGVKNVSYTEMRNELAPKLGRLTCLHRINQNDKPLVPESAQCNGANCTPTEQDYPSYPQSGQSWSSIPYSEGNIGTSGCGLASMAMLASAATGKEIYPNDVYDATKSSSVIYPATSGDGMVALDKLVGNKYNFTVEQVDVNEGSKKDVTDKMREYLKKGYMIHLSGKGSAPFTKNGHYIGIFNIDNDDNVLVADSNLGNKTYKLSDVINAGYHGSAFSAIKGSGGVTCDDDSDNSRCSSNSDQDSSSGSYDNEVLEAVDKIINLAKKNGYEYAAKGHDADGSSYFDSILKNNAKVEVDCTGFASLVMYAAFGVKETFWTGSIAGNSNYIEVSKSNLRPGDIFNYNDSPGCKAHGGIILEIKNGKVTKIAQTGKIGNGYNFVGGAVSNASGRTLGYFEDPNGANSNMGCVNGAAPDVKYYRYKGAR